MRHPLPLSSSTHRGWSAPGTNVVRDGNVTAVMNREYDATITSTGGDPLRPPPKGISAVGNQRSHCAWSPAR